MGTVMMMKFVLTFICLVASVASMKGKHFIVETADENGSAQEEEQRKYQDGSDYSEGYSPSKYRDEEKYGSGKKYKSDTSYGSGKKYKSGKSYENHKYGHSDSGKYSSGKYGHEESSEEVEYHWGEWSDWHNSVTCGSGTRRRNRRCIGSDDSHGTSSQCGGGDSHEVEDRNFKPCKSYKKKRM